MLRWKRKNSLTDNTVYVFIPARAIKHSIACFNILPHILVVRWGRFSNFQIVYSFDKFKWNFEFTQNLCWYITRLIYNTFSAYMYHLHNMLTLHCVNVIAALQSKYVHNLHNVRWNLYVSKVLIYTKTARCI